VRATGGESSRPRSKSKMVSGAEDGRQTANPAECQGELEEQCPLILDRCLLENFTVESRGRRGLCGGEVGSLQLFLSEQEFKPDLFREAGDGLGSAKD